MLGNVQYVKIYLFCFFITLFFVNQKQHASSKVDFAFDAGDFCDSLTSWHHPFFQIQDIDQSDLFLQEHLELVQQSLFVLFLQTLIPLSRWKSSAPPFPRLQNASTISVLSAKRDLTSFFHIQGRYSIVCTPVRHLHKSY